jgi:putative colanic acid biosynthesis UDP-glucose lipid carrier transferase
LSLPLNLVAARDAQPRFAQNLLGPSALLRAAIDPAIAIGGLIAFVLLSDRSFSGAYLVLSLLVFAMTFPGGLTRGPQSADDRAGLLREIMFGWLVVAALLLALGWASGTLASFDHNVLLAWAIATPFAIFATRLTLPLVLPRVLAAQGAQKVAVIAGACSHGRRLAERIGSDPLLGMRVAGYFDDRAPERLDGIDPSHNLGSLNQLAEYVKHNHVDLIYIALPMAFQPRILALLEELHDTTASIYFAPDIFLFDLIQARVDTIAGLPVLAVCESPYYGFDGLLKRASDIVFASLILLMIAPLLVAIGIGVKLSSPGPVLFRQRRYGLDGREILVYKFRSMRVLEDGAVVTQASRGDPRVTRFGAFLRATSLDELPQFINVLQGRMSVVGPRPHAIAHNEMYRKLIRGYMIRHKVRPGITGLAQVNGMRGETDTLDKMQARIEYDLSYLRNWSLLLDVQIIVRTVFVVLKRQNAY